MANNPIKRGLKVQIEFETGSRKSRIDCYIINPDFDRLTLSFPESKKEFIPYLIEGTEIKAFIYTFSGIMIIDSIVFDAPFDGKFVIEFNEDQQVIQRRVHIRVLLILIYTLSGRGLHIRLSMIKMRVMQLGIWRTQLSIMAQM